ncbi:MAG: hypothetical protein JW795_17540 [Chitinivibrionales bacterium]|nr:hypothetical protein [Chitinivibrionales bacterium]
MALFNFEFNEPLLLVAILVVGIVVMLIPRKREVCNAVGRINAEWENETEESTPRFICFTCEACRQRNAG